MAHHLPIPHSHLYAGIGSRATPQRELSLIASLAEFLARYKVTLRSGGAPGADSAFEKGCDEAGGKKQIFLPWRGFNANPSALHTPPPEAYALAKLLHPCWSRCNAASRHLHARNCQQILGPNLDEPVDFVLFWALEDESGAQGGTATAIRLARELSIPTFNLWRPYIRSYWANFIKPRPAPLASGGFYDCHPSASLKSYPSSENP